MKKHRFTEEQIIVVQKERKREADTLASDLGRMCEEASGLDGGLGWDWTAKRTSIWTAHRCGR